MECPYSLQSVHTQAPHLIQRTNDDLGNHTAESREPSRPQHSRLALLVDGPASAPGELVRAQIDARAEELASQTGA